MLEVPRPDATLGRAWTPPTIPSPASPPSWSACRRRTSRSARPPPSLIHQAAPEERRILGQAAAASRAAARAPSEASAKALAATDDCTRPSAAGASPCSWTDAGAVGRHGHAPRRLPALAALAAAPRARPAR